MFLKKKTSQPIFTLQGKKFVSIVPKPESEDTTASNMFKSLAGGLKSDKKCRKVRDAMMEKIASIMNMMMAAKNSSRRVH